ncbi:aspartate 4-decarboxylase [Vagococcus vulneris]|uniref:Aminotransferase n=1 Tax=Vagococcus vulneris TaxID=1977869 RepID=A0A429ZQ20_9ENTE|nr:aspartate 4-decarboxylase [Vagococcus vulneris]RST95804.1 aspartate 4-decarboxylase [Vagococcus vulneris]
MISENNKEQLSPFELSLLLEKKVKEKDSSISNLLNAGRGNPNWIAPIPREAYFLLGQFALSEVSLSQSGLTADMINQNENRESRYLSFLAAHKSEGADLLHEIWSDNNSYLGMSKENWLAKMLDYIIGDNYPQPVRVLDACEQPIKQYLNQKLFLNQQTPFDIFSVEGGTAGICYLFDTLVNNFLLNKGDKIALMLPMFAPYLELPELPHYEFDIVKVNAKQTMLHGKLTYQYPEEELAKLKDPSIKAVFVVNPSNPTANAMCDSSIDQIKQIVSADNPNLMILTDDVYGTFVPKFRSLFAELPKNTACIYSYSKYFGATGWRIGNIIIGKDNIFDKLIADLPMYETEKLTKRYSSMDISDAAIPFIDRLVADSRDISLNHAAGVSAPQQAMMALFSLYALLDSEEKYKKEVMGICHRREELLFQTIGLDEPLQSLNTAYYCELNLNYWLRKRYGADFTDYLVKTSTITEILTELAVAEELLVLKANGFGSDDWAIRISLANLPTKDYQEVGNRLIRLFDRLKQNWKSQMMIGGH